jgi:hypothetical protein
MYIRGKLIISRPQITYSCRSANYDFKLDSTNSIPSPGKGNSPQVYHAKPTLPDSTSDGQVTGSITGKTSLSSPTTPKFRGALSKTEGLKEIWVSYKVFSLTQIITTSA